MSTAKGGLPGHELDGEALDWALRMADPDADWDAFTAWLEADPSRAARYDAASIALDQVTGVVAQQARSEHSVANDPAPLGIEIAPENRSRRVWLGGAMAAAIAGAIGLGTWYQPDRTYTVATKAGEQRTIDLADGSSIVLGGGSRVQLDKDRPRFASLKAGEVLFTVRHDEKSPFHVLAGDLELVDLGTVFNVRMRGSQTNVAVAEGAVRVDRDGAALRLNPGEAAVFDGETLRRERQEVTEIGGWRKGLLAFSDATIGEVAEELSRNLGLRITAKPAVQRRTFNGTLELTALRRDPTLLGSLLDVQVRRDGDGWTLDALR